jgi:hypothetical protein
MWHPGGMRSLRVVGFVAGLAAVVAGLALGSAWGAQVGPRLTVVPASGRAGQTIAVRGYGFRPKAKGLVVLGARRVASFRAGTRGLFLVRFVVPPDSTGRLRIVAEKTVRNRHGSPRRLRLAAAHFRVVALGLDGGTIRGPSGRPPAGTGGSAAGAGGNPGGSTGSSTGAGGAGGSPAGSTSGSTSGSASESTGGSTVGSTGPTGSPTGGSTGGRWVPPEHLTWYWQLQGSVNNGEPVAAYDIDGFENTAAEVSALHAKGIHVICYIDVGTYEPSRPDSSAFPATVLGSGVEGWPGEKWLDIGSLSVLEPIMKARFGMCKEKGFDAVEPDNMDGYENSTGFSITAQQQLAYDEWVATEVHSLGMAVFQKNDGEQTGQLESYFDGALDEQCNQYSECSNFQAYLKAGKPVLNAEYELAASAFCAADNAAGIMGARYDLELDGKTFEPCW